VAIDVRHPIESLLYAPSAAERHRQLLLDAADVGARLFEVAPPVLAALTSAANPPDLLAVAAVPHPTASGAGVTLVLHAVRDPAAVGSLLASAASAGAARAVTVAGTADPYASTPVRIAAGAHFVLDLAEAPTVAASLDGARPVVVLADDGPAPWQVDLRGSPAIIVGDGSLEDYDARVCVPSSATAAPLAVRGAVVLFEARRQREAR
jgi:tRNA G18 (ribose-2'-O)-methylase SpoU